MAKRNRDTDEPAEDLVADALAVLGTDLPDVAEDPAEDALDGDLLDTEDYDATEREIPADLTFTTKKKTPDAGAGEILEMKLDDQVIYARKPSKGAWSLVLGAVSRSANQADKTQALLEFTFAALDQPSQILVKSRMFDAHDDFDIDDLSAIVSKMIEKWAPAQSRAERRHALGSRTDRDQAAHKAGMARQRRR